MSRTNCRKRFGGTRHFNSRINTSVAHKGMMSSRLLRNKVPRAAIVLLALSEAVHQTEKNQMDQMNKLVSQWLLGCAE